MGKQSRRKRDPGRGRGGPRIDGVALLKATIRVDGQATPLVSPIGSYEDHADFDRELCAAGMKRFIRERMHSDWSSLAGIDLPPAPAHVLVEEAAAGARCRRAILVVFNHEMN